MKWPTSLKIGAHRYNLIFADSWAGCDGELGETHYEDDTIYIKSGLSETTEFQTVLHEIFHVINAKLDHVLLESLSEQLSQVLLDNGLIKDS